MTTDPHAASPAHFPPAERADLLVMGAGPAGIAAALAGARAGRSVVLFDENPVPPSLIGMDVPLLFGGRATAAVQNPARMLEQVLAASPDLATAFDLGVDVRLGTCAWGAWRPGPALAALPGPVVGLADAEHSWLCGFSELVVAAGARDLVLGFAGAELPGVVGAQALHALLVRYGAFAGRRLVVLGGGPFGLATAALALDHGCEVAAVVEVREAPQGPAALRARLSARGVELLDGHTILAAEGGADGVAAAIVLDASGARRTIPCDTICLAVGRVPNVELLDVLGAPLVWRPERGGHVPQTEAPLPGVRAVGDCAGIEADPTHALDWMRRLLETGGADAPACLCEEISRGELLGLRPPRYLGEAPPRMAGRDLRRLAQDGPVNQDQIKRLTRACMGPCQARRCREQVAMLLALGTGVDPGEIPLAGYRAPVRPLPLALLAATEQDAMRAGWDVWFGIESQWTPYADIGTEREHEHGMGHL
jgi:thioredoxin reductase